MNYLRTREKRSMVLGAFLSLAGLLRATSFFYVENHAWYWNVPHFLCIITWPPCASGSLPVADLCLTLSALFTLGGLPRASGLDQL